LTNETAAQIDPRWEAARSYADRLLLAVQHDAVRRGTPDDPYLFTSATVRDILLTEPSTPFCALGKAMHLSHREHGVVQNLYARCRGGKCPHCVGYWLTEILRRALRLWDYPEPEQLHRSVFISDAEWRNTARGRNLRAAYPGQFLWVRTGYHGVREVFTPGPGAGGEPVTDPVGALVDALLRAPAAGARRFGGLHAEEKPDSGWHAFELPEGTSPEDACRVCEGALGRPLGWECTTRRRGGAFYKRWVVCGLAPAEVDRIQEALRPLRERAAYAQAMVREAQRARRAQNAAFAAWAATLQDGHFLKGPSR
jgi:hypothetical protein